MTDYVVSGPQLVQQELEANDTLLVESVGSIVTAGDAIVWDLDSRGRQPSRRRHRQRRPDPVHRGSRHRHERLRHGPRHLADQPRHDHSADDDAFRIDNTLDRRHGPRRQLRHDRLDQRRPGARLQHASRRRLDHDHQPGGRPHPRHRRRRHAAGRRARSCTTTATSRPSRTATASTSRTTPAAPSTTTPAA